MSHFGEILHRVLEKEGNYSNDPVDAGGETVRGIARNFWPQWAGWPYVDARKAERSGPYFSDLEPLVKEHYRVHFWTPLRGDEISSFEVASRLFDIAVNAHPVNAIRFLQEALNLLNRNGKSWEELIEDGLMGPKTLGTLKKAKEKHVTRLLEVLQGMHYVELVRRKPSQERFLRGWLSRIYD